MPTLEARRLPVLKSLHVGGLGSRRLGSVAAGFWIFWAVE